MSEIAIVNYAPQAGSVEIREVATPAIGADDVLLEVGAVGVCGTSGGKRKRQEIRNHRERIGGMARREMLRQKSGSHARRRLELRSSLNCARPSSAGDYWSTVGKPS